MNDTFADVLAINQIFVPIRSHFISDLYKSFGHVYSIQKTTYTCFEVYCEIKPFYNK